MPKALTERQNQVFEFVRSYARDRGRPPTMAEIGRALAIRSTNGVFKQLKALEAKGYIRRDFGAARGIVILNDEIASSARLDDIVQVPILPRAALEDPVSYRQRPSGRMCIDRRLLGSADDEACALVGVDQSNESLAVFRGDLVLVDISELSYGLLEGKAVLVSYSGSALATTVHTRQSGQYLVTDGEGNSWPADSTQIRVMGTIQAVIRKL